MLQFILTTVLIYSLKNDISKRLLKPKLNTRSESKRELRTLTDTDTAQKALAKIITNTITKKIQKGRH